jgi:hypothetical protein
MTESETDFSKRIKAKKKKKKGSQMLCPGRKETQPFLHAFSLQWRKIPQRDFPFLPPLHQALLESDRLDIYIYIYFLAIAGETRLF